MISGKNISQTPWTQFPNAIAKSLDELEQLKMRVSELEKKQKEEHVLFERLPRKKRKRIVWYIFWCYTHIEAFW